MKRIATTSLVPGMVLAENIFNYSKQLVLEKGTTLTDTMITKLTFYSIMSVYIMDEPVPSLSSFPKESYATRLKESKDFKEFKNKYDRNVNTFKLALNNVVRKNAPLDTDDLLYQTYDLLNTPIGHPNIMNILQNMRSYDDSTYAHSLNVSLICNLFGEWIGMSEEEIRTVTLCGLLHDIGKLMVPTSILNKPARLSEEEFEAIKLHPSDGYKILKHSKVDERICNAALMHHEKCDGSGYPFGISGNKIDPYAKIVTIADIYDSMTSARIYRGPMCPFKVVAIFEEEGFQKYDTGYIMIFLSHVVNTYLLNRVQLSNGQEGDIIYINQAHLSKPTIRCADDTYIDLTTRPDLSIMELI